jgi:TPR repeat protein
VFLSLLIATAAAADPLATPEADEVMRLTQAALAGDTTALPLLAAQCDSGVGFACGNLASLLRKGVGGPARVAETTALLEKGCTAGWALACGDLGYVLARGEGVPADPERGYRYTREACEKGYAPSCGEAADMLVSGYGVAVDAAAARGLFERACAGQSWRFCTKQGGVYEQGIGGAVDLLKSEDAYLAACTHGQAEACGRLPWVVAAQGDAERAFRLSEELCKQAIAPACVWSGTALRKGQGTAIDAKASAVRYGQACDAKEALGCAGIAALHLEAGRDAKAKVALEKACELGLTAACGAARGK